LLTSSDYELIAAHGKLSDMSLTHQKLEVEAFDKNVAIALNKHVEPVVH